MTHVSAATTIMIIMLIIVALICADEGCEAPGNESTVRIDNVICTGEIKSLEEFYLNFINCLEFMFKTNSTFALLNY